MSVLLAYSSFKEKQMTHDELLLLVSDSFEKPLKKAIISIVELHKPTPEAVFVSEIECKPCNSAYPCPTIQAIEKESK